MRQVQQAGVALRDALNSGSSGKAGATGCRPFPFRDLQSLRRNSAQFTATHSREREGERGKERPPQGGAAERGAYAPGGHHGRRWGEPRLGSVDEERRVATASRCDDVDLSAPKGASGLWGAKPPPPPQGGHLARVRAQRVRRKSPAGRGLGARPSGGGAARGRQTPRRRRSRRRRVTSGARRQPRADRPKGRPQRSPPRDEHAVSAVPREGARTKLDN